eukprot:jgi/Mesvir1/19440/Mv10467-RA.1
MGVKKKNATRKAVARKPTRRHLARAGEAVLSGSALSSVMDALGRGERGEHDLSTLGLVNRELYGETLDRRLRNARKAADELLEDFHRKGCAGTRTRFPRLLPCPPRHDGMGARTKVKPDSFWDGRKRRVCRIHQSVSPKWEEDTDNTDMSVEEDESVPSYSYTSSEHDEMEEQDDGDSM